MDNPEQAAGLSDSSLADAVNREWLTTSGQLSMDRRRYHLELISSLSSLSFYGSIGKQNEQSYKAYLPEAQRSQAPGWLQRHYMNRKQETVYKKGPTVDPAINSHLYDKISLADSPQPLARKDIRELSGVEEPLVGDDPSEPTGCFFGRFRIFLACYLLLGITLAIYSRNALSLAAVGMVANNEINKELVEIYSHSSAALNGTKSRGAGLVQEALEGSCPVIAFTNGASKTANSSQAFHLMLNYLPPELDYAQASRAQLEAAFRASIQQRIERGELVDWSPSQQGLIFAAGSLGNLLIAVPLTRLGEIYGPKWIIFVASLGATIQAALMPTVSPAHVSLVILFQVIFNGLTYGADCVTYTLFAHWLSPTEMAFFVSCLLICYQMGTIISSFITAKILTEGLPWSWCFYTPAILCGIWTLIWAIIGSSEPTGSMFVSRRELNYLQRRSKLSQVSGEFSSVNSQSHQAKHQKEPISWLKIVRDPNVWAIIAVKFTLRWYFSVYTSLMPTFLSSVAHMSVDTIGRVSVFQSIIGLLSGIIMGYLTKSMVLKRPFNLSLATFRKISQSIVNFGLSISLLVFISLDCNKWATIISLTIGGICVNFYVAAALQLPMDLSPSHCGLITSISNTLAVGQAIGAPISGLILNGGPKDRNLWRIVWTITILLNIFSGLLFILLVDSKRRDYSQKSASQLEGVFTRGSLKIQVTS